MDEKEEKEIIHLCVYGVGQQKNNALNKLLWFYRPKILDLTQRKIKDKAAAEDITQNVLIRVMHGIHQFRCDCKFYSWLYRIVTNEVAYYCTKEKKYEHYKLNDCNDTFAELVNHKKNEIEAKILTCIKCLPKKQGEILKMRCLDGLSYEEISKQTGMVIPTIKANMSHARRKTIAAINRGYFIYQEKPKQPKKRHLI